MTPAVMIPLISALGLMLVGIGVVGQVWNPARKYLTIYRDVAPSYGPVQAMVIAGAGGQMRADMDASLDASLSSEPHRLLGVTEQSYKSSMLVNGVILGAIVAVLSWPTLGLIGALIAGICFSVLGSVLLQWTLVDSLKQAHVKQARQFPFFLDIFLLTVQSGGGLDDAIAMYLKVFGRDPLGRELNILAETFRASNEEESFLRLSARVGDPELKKAIGELAQKLRSGVEMAATLEAQRNDLRAMREEHAAKIAEALNAKFMICVVLAAASVFLIILSLPVATLMGSNVVF
ncbi:Type II secretion system (T2SS), protein F [Loktanella sp. DSM 29012]|uniref:Type II secretion system F family protein n=1 Tax=Loktanella gaetbuli TaxID=2881335 RepID=A0ABS8BY04_9RHOB|nr:MULTISPECIES: type II secretion system F family protein [Loktanella]KQI66926.1 hypothetical protein AN189_18170 [Loktanella sp. 3ANDIMAR09]MCB5200585.1 type II secretion system F family protein [Loktanella gaetbuli]SEQ35924.1 Type II secretion system (T2SS), protein F [Loktanella sp. DSM 29012]